MNDHPDQPTEPVTSRAASQSASNVQNTPQTPPRVSATLPEEQPATAMPPRPSASPARTSAPDDRSWLWPITNLIGAVVVILTYALANLFQLNGLATRDIVNRVPVPYQPASWVFILWTVVYSLLAIFVVYGLFPAGRRNTSFQRISPAFLVANLASIAWIICWHYERLLASLVALCVLLVALLGMYIGLRFRHPLHRNDPVHRPSIVEQLAVRLPISAYLGWVVVVTLINLMMWLGRSGWSGGPLSYNGWTVLFLLGGTLISALFAWLARDPVIPIVILVAYVGIASHAWGQSMLVAVFAIIFTVAQAGIIALAWIMSSEDARPSPMPRQTSM